MLSEGGFGVSGCTLDCQRMFMEGAPNALGSRQGSPAGHRQAMAFGLPIVTSESMNSPSIGQSNFVRMELKANSPIRNIWFRSGDPEIKQVDMPQLSEATTMR